jgi:hypothetical protein
MVSMAPFSNLGKQFCAVSLGHVAGKAKLHLSIVNAWSFLYAFVFVFIACLLLVIFAMCRLI